MASFQIDELITGIPLFVPDAYNRFSIDPGGLPNGDDCLIVHGDVGRDYKAFQRAQAMSPAIFSGKDYTTVFRTMSIVMWIKSSPVTFAGVGYNSQIIMAVMTSAAAPSGISNTDWAGNSAVWIIAASTTGTNQIGMMKRTASSGTGASASMTGTPPTDTWTMVTFNPSQATDGGLYLNDSATPAGSWSAVGNGTFPNLGVSNAFLSLGSYANHANLNGRDGEYRLGKISFHDHHLNATERALLYNAMI